MEGLGCCHSQPKPKGATQCLPPPLSIPQGGRGGEGPRGEGGEASSWVGAAEVATGDTTDSPRGLSTLRSFTQERRDNKDSPV